MAKNDLFSSRTTAIERDQATEQFYRPAAPSKPRASRPREFDLPQSESRFVAQPPGDETADREQEPFLRARRRVPVRRGFLPRTRTGRIIFAGSAAAALCLSLAVGFAVRNFLRDDPRFRIDSASDIQSMGNSHVARQELLSVFGSDVGRNVFFVPLAERRAELEQIPWVKGATVMRLLPNQLRVSIVERVPVAFVRNGNTIGLVDEDGVLLNLPPARMAVKHYSFPVVTGLSARDPLSVRAARMHLYLQFINDLNSGGAPVSEQLSEVDISDPEDIRAVLPAHGSGILVHFGNGSFLERYRRYRQHLTEWQKQYPHLASADMRYENQVVLEMSNGTAAASNGYGSELTSGQIAAKARTQPLADLKSHSKSSRPAVHAVTKLSSARARKLRSSSYAPSHKPLRRTSRSTTRGVVRNINPSQAGNQHRNHRDGNPTRSAG